MGAIEKAIYHRSVPGVRNPEGFRARLGVGVGGGADLKALSRRLNNREIYNYSKERCAVKSNKLAEIIRNHCLTIEFMGVLGG